MKIAITRWAPFMPFAVIALGLAVLEDAWLAFLLYHLAIIGVAVATGWHRRLPDLVAGWRLAAGTGGIVLGGAGGGLLWLFWPQLGIGSDLARSLSAIGLSGAAWTGFVAYHVFVNPWLEELFWRGVLGRSDRGITLSDIAFGAYHLLVLMRFVSWPWLLPAVAVLSAAGWLWRQLTRASGGLLPAVLSHMAGDFCVFLPIVLHLS